MSKFNRVIVSLLLASLTLNSSANTVPIAVSDLVVVDSAESVVVRLKGYDKTVKNVRTSLRIAIVTFLLYITLSVMLRRFIRFFNPFNWHL